MLLHFIFVVKEEELQERKKEFEYVKEMAKFFQKWSKEHFSEEFDIEDDDINDNKNGQNKNIKRNKQPWKKKKISKKPSGEINYNSEEYHKKQHKF